MLSIYICEDHPLMLGQIEKIVRESCMIEDLDFHVELAVKNPHQLLHHLVGNQKRNIYFLDVDLSDNLLNGFELGKRIRKLDPKGFIIFVTSHEELLPETFKYKLEALDYILKDDNLTMAEQIRSSLLEICNRLQSDPFPKREIFTLETASRILHVFVDDIQYFETTGKKHTIALVTSEEYIEFYDTLNNLSQVFAHQFIRTHQSYLVNQLYLSALDKKNKKVILLDGSTCLVSRGNMKKVQQYFIQ